MHFAENASVLVVVSMFVAPQEASSHGASVAEMTNLHFVHTTTKNSPSRKGALGLCTQVAMVFNISAAHLACCLRNMESGQRSAASGEITGLPEVVADPETVTTQPLSATGSLLDS